MTIENEVITLPHEPGEEPYIYMKKRKYKELDNYKYDTKNIIIPVLRNKIEVLEQVIKLNDISIPKEV
jgi:hypothetical protein